MRWLVAFTMLCACQRSASELLAGGDRDLATETLAGAQRAAAAYRKALALTTDPTLQIELHSQLAEALQLAEPDRRETELKRVVDLAGDKEEGLIASAEVAGAAPSGATKMDSLRTLVEKARASGARRAEVVATSRLADAAIEARDLKQAEALLGQALALVHTVVDARLEARVERSLATGYYVFGDGDKASAHVARSLEIARAAKLPLEEADAYFLQGNILQWNFKDAVTALVPYARARTAYVALGLEGFSAEVDARVYMAWAQNDAGDPAAAVATLERALEAARRLPKATRNDVIFDCLGALGDAYIKSDRPGDSAKVFAELATLAKQENDMHRFMLGILGGADAAIVQERYREVEAVVEPALAYVAASEAEVKDETLRLSLTIAQRNIAERLVHARAGLHDWNRAFQASEILRARRLLLALGETTLLDGDGARALLDDDTALVEYVTPSTRNAYAIVVDKTGTTGVDLGPSRDIVQSAREWYKVAASPSASAEALEGATGRLGELLLGPVASLLHGKRLVIVPDGSLNYVSFPALPLPDGKRLVERYEIVDVPSASVLAALRARAGARPVPTHELAILADPIFDRGDARLGGSLPPVALVASRDGETELARLPWTHSEAEAIASLVPPSQLFLAEGAAATRQAALGPDVLGARRVHFATHAILDTVDYDKSGLALSQVDAAGAPVAGFVRVADIEKAHFAAELVVLSACKTAIGKRFNGEGLVGLTRSFLRAGVPRVVSSLWQVDDAATADLMARFYRGLLTDKLTAPAALRRAQIDMIARKEPIRLWAPFGFHGDWR